jgi:hypothetical protein
MALAHHHHGEKSGNLYRLPARELFDFYLAILRQEPRGSLSELQGLRDFTAGIASNGMTRLHRRVQRRRR